MDTYSIILFIHIVGAVGFFVALGLEWTGLSQMRAAATPEPVRAWIGVLQNVRKVGFVSMLTTVITGAYMMMTVWNAVPWLIVTVGSLILLIVLAQGVTAPRMAAVGRALATEQASLSQAFYEAANQPMLLISVQTRAAISLAIIFLKVIKPELGGSLLAIGVAVVLGFASSLPRSRRAQLGEASTD